MNAPRKVANASNWRNLAAETADLRELRRWVKSLHGTDAANEAVRWMLANRGELPQLKTGLNPRAQQEMLLAGQGIDGIPAAYCAGITTQMVTEDDPDCDPV